VQPRRDGRGAGRDVPERPLAPRPVTRQLDQRTVARWRGLDDVAGEVHGAED
jgi:hypothetical protein